MTPDYEPTIKRITEIVGNAVDTRDNQVCADLMLRGFLTSPDVLRKCFGEEVMYRFNGVWYKPELATAKLDAQQPAWQYHGQNLVPLDLPGVLNYYKEWLKV